MMVVVIVMVVKVMMADADDGMVLMGIMTMMLGIVGRSLDHSNEITL